MGNVSEQIQALQSQITEHQEAIIALQEELSQTDHYMAAYYDYRYNLNVTDTLFGDPMGSQFKNLRVIEEQRADLYKQIYPHKVAMRELQAKKALLQKLQTGDAAGSDESTGSSEDQTENEPAEEITEG